MSIYANVARIRHSRNTGSTVPYRYDQQTRLAD